MDSNNATHGIPFVIPQASAMPGQEQEREGLEDGEGHCL